MNNLDIQSKIIVILTEQLFKLRISQSIKYNFLYNLRVIKINIKNILNKPNKELITKLQLNFK